MSNKLRVILRAPRDPSSSVPKLPPSPAAPRATAPKTFSELEECRRTRAEIEKGVTRCEAALAARLGQPGERGARRDLVAERARLRRFDRLVVLQERVERAEARRARAATCTCGLREACEASARAQAARAKLALAKLGLRNFQIAIAETRRMIAAAQATFDEDAAFNLQLKTLLASLPLVESRLRSAQKEVDSL
jgi:hypothetical protein